MGSTSDVVFLKWGSPETRLMGGYSRIIELLNYYFSQNKSVCSLNLQKYKLWNNTTFSTNLDTAPTSYVILGVFPHISGLFPALL